MPSLCGSAEATREWFRAFTAHSFLACRPLRPRGIRHRYPELRCRHWPSPNDHRLGTPNTPAIRSTRATISWLHWFASATACQVARPPVRIRLARPAFGDFYFQAFNGSVSLPVAGYNYNSDWTPLLAGLSPAGMAASLAARSFASFSRCLVDVRLSSNCRHASGFRFSSVRANSRHAPPFHSAANLR
jgi:hypothetical protein